MPKLSSRALNLPRSGIREIMERASVHDDVIHLEVGEPSFRTPQHIIDSAHEAATAGFTRYTSNYGLPSLRQAIADRYTAKWGFDVHPAQTLVTAGGVNAIAVTTYAIIEPGDEILIPDPGWPNYVSIAMLGSGVPVPYPMQPANRYLPDIEDLEKLVTPRTRILIINNPSNPTGVVFPHETVQAMIDFANRHDLYVISDEIYEELVFDGTHIPAATVDTQERVITISGFSKTYAMTGWRLGYAIGPESVITVAGKLMEPLVSSASSVSQKAGEAALTGPQDAVDEMRQAYLRRRDLACELLEPHSLLPVAPSGAFYAMIDPQLPGRSGRDIALSLIDSQRVAVAPGPTFGGVSNGMIRVSLASSDDDIEAGCRRIIEFVSSQSS